MRMKWWSRLNNNYHNKTIMIIKIIKLFIILVNIILTKIINKKIIMILIYLITNKTNNNLCISKTHLVEIEEFMIKLFKNKKKNNLNKNKILRNHTIILICYLLTLQVIILNIYQTILLINYRIKILNYKIKILNTRKDKLNCVISKFNSQKPMKKKWKSSVKNLIKIDHLLDLHFNIPSKKIKTNSSFSSLRMLLKEY